MSNGDDSFQDRMDHQAATIEVLRAMAASPGDPRPVFDLIVQRARTLCASANAGLYEYDGVLLHRRAWIEDFGTPEGRAQYGRSFPRRLEDYPDTATSIAINERRVVHVGDADAEPNVMPGGRRLGMRAAVVVPIPGNERSLGAIALGNAEPGRFTDEQLALLETFAEQAAIAITTAETYRALRDSLDQQTATAEVLGVINTSLGDLTPVFDAMLEKAMRLLDVPYGVFRTYDGTRFHPAASRGVPAAYEAYVAAAPGLLTADFAGPVREFLETKRVVHILDMREDESYRSGHPLMRALVDIAGVRTNLWVPLVKDDTVLGLIGVYRTEVRAFLPREIALLENFAAQAVIAMDNARLLTEQREALERQTATAEVLRVINDSPGNLPPVFDVVLEKALTLSGSTFGVLYTYDGENLAPGVMRNLPPAFEAWSRDREVWFRPRASIERNPAIIVNRLVLGEDLVQVLDARDDDAYRSGMPQRVALVDLGGARSVLGVAFRKDGALLGAMLLYRQEVRAYTEAQIDLVQGFAAQAVIAMHNARLITEQREALERQTAMADLLRVINESPGDLAPVFETILEKAHQFCGAPSGNLTLYENGMLRAAATRGCPVEYVDYVSKPFPLGPYQQWLLNGDRLVHVHDGQNDHDVNDSEIARIFRERTGFRTLMMIPLRKENRLLGMISAFRPEVRPFSDAEITLIENFAAQAVIAMENARLLAEQAEALERQTAVADVLQVINRSPGDLTPVFNAMLERAFRLCDAEAGSLWVMDGDTVTIGALDGFSEPTTAFLSEPFIPGPQTGIGRLMAGEELVQIADLADAPGYRAGETMHRLAIDVDGLHSLVAVPLRKDGTFLGAFGMMRRQPGFFTDRQISLLRDFAAQAVIAMENARLLNEIRQREGELDVTFQSMGDGVALFDETLHLAAWNQNFQDMIDVPTEFVSTKPLFRDYIQYLADRGEYGADTAQTVARLLSQVGQTAAFERTRPNGQVVQIRTNPTPTGGFVVIYTDITERKRAEEALRSARDAAENALRELKIAQANLVQAEKMASLGQLTAGIAHEIKNPLNFVNNFAALSVDLLDEFKEAAAPVVGLLSDDQRADLDDVSDMLTINLRKIEEHGKRADGIVRAMLEHSRGASGERRAVDINTLVDEALNLAYHGARARDQSFNITLERDYAEGIAPIEVNPQDLTRVFLNIIGNGFYAATKRERESGGDPPVLRVSTQADGDAVKVSIRDNGTGIPPDIRDKLFQPFFTTKPIGEGTGLGLSITYDIVTKQHGGAITVDSEPGVYTTFVVTLPRAMFGGDGGRS
jgi:GAF domain-containing protein/nitrogen-specific signal transduction histidine kinase